MGDVFKNIRLYIIKMIKHHSYSPIKPFMLLILFINFQFYFEFLFPFATLMTVM